VYRDIADKLGIETNIEESTDAARMRYQLQTNPIKFIDSIKSYAIANFQGMYAYVDLWSTLHLRSRKTLTEQQPTRTFIPLLYTGTQRQPSNTIMLQAISLLGENNTGASILTTRTTTSNVTLVERYSAPSDSSLAIPKSVLGSEDVRYGDAFRSPQESVALRINQMKKIQDFERGASLIIPYKGVDPILLGEVVEARTSEFTIQGIVLHIDHFLLEGSLLTKLYIAEL
jgi:hypothetical protein